MTSLLYSGCAAPDQSSSTSTDQDSSAPDQQKKYEYNNRSHSPLNPKTTYIHIVKYPGESLSIIAAWYTGDLQNWKKLAQANPDFNPAKIFIGDRIRIPKKLMIKYNPMPEKFINKFVIKKPRPPESTKPAAVVPEDKSAAPETEQEEVPLLFGPK